MWQILKGLLGNTDAWPWISRHDERENGRLAWIDLCIHYDGLGEVRRRVATSKGILSRLSYKKESVFPFTKFAGICVEHIQILHDNGAPKSDSDQVSEFLAKISDHAPPFVLTAKINVMMDARCKNDLMATIEEIGEVIAEVSAPATGRDNGRDRRVAANQVTRGAGGNRGRGRGGGNQNANMIDGVDVSDANRNFNSREYETLRRAG